jgi:hypothetical protein
MREVFFWIEVLKKLFNGKAKDISFFLTIFAAIEQNAGCFGIIAAKSF